MKISSIRNKFDKAKALLSEYSMLDALIKAMIKAQKERPEELGMNEVYFANVSKRIENIKLELEELFK
jgi:hypothetical protein